MNVAGYLLENTKDQNSDFLITEKRRLTFIDFHAQVKTLSSHFSAILDGKGHMILLMADDGFFFTVAYLAILHSGNIAVLVEYTASDEDLNHIIELTKPDAYCSLSSQNKRMKRLLKNARCINENFLNRIPVQKSVPIAELSENDVAHIIFTSGSTGPKKGVMITHKNIRANTESIIDYLELTKKDRIAAVLPFTYSYGLSLLHTHLRVGGSILLCRGQFIAAALDDIVNYSCTGFAGVPSTYELFIKHTDFLTRKFSSLRYFTQAGGPMAPETIQRITEAFPKVKFFVMYGATEATTRLSYLPPERLHDKLGSIGKGVPGVELKIVDSKDNRVPSGATGELIARGSNIMKGYLKDGSETGRVIKKGWLYTGDLATADSDGFIYIVGRIKNIIKSAGYRISPHEIEHALSPLCGSCAAVGVPDPIRGESIALIVEAPSDDEVLRQKILAEAQAVLPSHAVPMYVWFVRSLPRNSSKKIDLPQLRQLAQEYYIHKDPPKLEKLLGVPQYCISSVEKAATLLALCRPLLVKAEKNNGFIRSWFQKQKFNPLTVTSITDIPYLPIQMFKQIDTAICPKADITRIITSSGTTGAIKSQVPLDKTTSINQTGALTATLATYLGEKRRSFIVIDHEGINAPNHSVSARTMGVRGLSAFASNTEYILIEDANGNLSINDKVLEKLQRNEKPTDLYLFGFTYIIWSVLYRELIRRNIHLLLGKVHLFHSGGWKKLEEEKISKEDFNASIESVLGIPSSNVHEFYGMAEEGGVLFVDCPAGYKHAPDVAAVILRDFHTLLPVSKNTAGYIEIVSALPESYYGQAVLTEDIGRLIGTDDCPCGKKGEYFEFLGRVPHAELRGCGDTFKETL